MNYEDQYFGAARRMAPAGITRRLPPAPGRRSGRRSGGKSWSGGGRRGYHSKGLRYMTSDFYHLNFLKIVKMFSNLL